MSTANGMEANVIGKGSFFLNELNLDFVLVVPSLNFNLLSVSRITSLNCVVIFWPDYCVFKDIKIKKIIRCGTRKGKLYYLDLAPPSLSALTQSEFTTSSVPILDIWLWHKRLGNVPFVYLKYLFPKLFSKTSPSLFKCETCELAKSHRVPFPISLNKISLPFMLVHSDVWGPAKVPTLNGS